MRTHNRDVEGGQELLPKAARLDQENLGLTYRAAAAGRTDVLGPVGLLSLQRAVGNAGVGALVADQERSPVLDIVNSGGGSPLGADTRADMESRLGHDFSDVRVHTDSRTHESAQAVHAHAYTVGSNVVFQRDKYDASSMEGRTMLAHELTHVVQQRNGPVDGTPAGGGVQISDPSDRFEREAAVNAERAMSAPAPAAVAQAGPSVQRQADEKEQPEDNAVQGSFVQRQQGEEAVRLGAVPAGTIQRSPLSDRVRAAAGPSPTLTSVLAALSGNDVQVNDPDLDQAINQLLGGRTEDIALAQQVRSRRLGTTSGWAGPTGTGSRERRNITARYVAGRTERRALVIAGAHGSEVQGVEVAQQLLNDLANAKNQPEMSAIIVPNLFPDDAAFRDREGPGAHPNRNFPEPSRDLAASGPNPKDALGKATRSENVMLMQLMERFSPERIISIHGTWDASKAGVSYDTRNVTAAEDARARAWGINPESDAPPGLVRARRVGFQYAADERDNRFALDAADLIDTRTRQGPTAGPARPGLKHPSVAGNFKGGSTKANFARWEGGMDKGVSLGGYASARGISIFTVEPPDNKTIDEYKGAARTAREVEINAYAEAVRTILLGS